MNKKQALRVAIFLIITAFLLVFICDMFEYESGHMTERYKTFKNQEPDTVDAVYIGTSAVDRFWIAGQAFEDYGMTVYPMSTNGQPVWLIKTMIEESLRHQDPQLVIIDIRSFTTDITKEVKVTDARCRYVIDMLDFFSDTRYDAIRRTKEVMCDINPEVDENDPSYFFSFIKYHTRWSKGNLSPDDITDPASSYLGFYMNSKWSAARIPIEASVYTDERMELEAHSEKYLYELIDYLRDNNIEALFVNSPHTVTYELSARTNTVFDILKEEGFNCIDYNTEEMLEKYPLDFETDFFDYRHANYWGAVKYTTYFSQYLDEHYDLPDRRDDEKCADWYGVTDLIEQQISTWEQDLSGNAM
ncbi:MAG: hypothetical protein IJP17_07590 [Clostridia bacterium]|nr:hypothetical protein [Clostridia bacterium]